MNIATIYAQLAAMVDKSLNAFSEINTLMLRMTNSSEQGIDAQAAVGLAQCSRNLRKKRETLAEVQESVHVLEAKLGPDQLAGVYILKIFCAKTFWIKRVDCDNFSG